MIYSSNNSIFSTATSKSQRVHRVESQRVHRVESLRYRIIRICVSVCVFKITNPYHLQRTNKLNSTQLKPLVFQWLSWIQLKLISEVSTSKHGSNPPEEPAAVLKPQSLNITYQLHRCCCNGCNSCNPARLLLEADSASRQSQIRPPSKAEAKFGTFTGSKWEPLKTLLQIYDPTWLSRSFRGTYATTRLAFATTRLAFADAESIMFAFAQLSRISYIQLHSDRWSFQAFAELSHSSRAWSFYFCEVS